MLQTLQQICSLGGTAGEVARLGVDPPFAGKSFARRSIPASIRNDAPHYRHHLSVDRCDSDGFSPLAPLRRSASTPTESSSGHHSLFRWLSRPARQSGSRISGESSLIGDPSPSSRLLRVVSSGCQLWDGEHDAGATRDQFWQVAPPAVEDAKPPTRCLGHACGWPTLPPKPSDIRHPVAVTTNSGEDSDRDDGFPESFMSGSDTTTATSLTTSRSLLTGTITADPLPRGGLFRSTSALAFSTSGSSGEGSDSSRASSTSSSGRDSVRRSLGIIGAEEPDPNDTSCGRATVLARLASFVSRQQHRLLQSEVATLTHETRSSMRGDLNDLVDSRTVTAKRPENEAVRTDTVVPACRGIDDAICGCLHQAGAATVTTGALPDHQFRFCRPSAPQSLNPFDFSVNEQNDKSLDSLFSPGPPGDPFEEVVFRGYRRIDTIDIDGKDFCVPEVGRSQEERGETAVIPVACGSCESADAVELDAECVVAAVLAQVSPGVAEQPRFATFLRKRISSQDPTPPTPRIVVILDWDDTLFPSSWLHFVHRCQDAKAENLISESALNADQWELIIKLEVSALALLQECDRACATVLIVTNAEPGWVQLCAGRFMPKVLNWIQGHDIQVVSARATFCLALQESAGGTGSSPWMPSDGVIDGAGPSGGIVEPDLWKLYTFTHLLDLMIDQHCRETTGSVPSRLSRLPNSAHAAQPYQGRRVPTAPEQTAFRRSGDSPTEPGLVMNMKHRSTSCGLLHQIARDATPSSAADSIHFVSIGDSECERRAILSCREKFYDEGVFFFKSIKLVENPHACLLLNQQEFLQNSLDHVLKVDDCLDLVFEPPSE